MNNEQDKSRFAELAMELMGSKMVGDIVRDIWANASPEVKRELADKVVAKIGAALDKESLFSETRDVLRQAVSRGVETYLPTVQEKLDAVEKTCEVLPNGPDTECGKPAVDETQGFPMCADCVAAYKLEGLYEPADVLDRALAVWLKHLTEDELVELSERLDGEPGHPLLYKLDEYLAKVRPELFADPLEGVTKEV